MKDASDNSGAGYTPEQWPVFDCMGRKVEYLNAQPVGAGMVCQGRAFREGQWLPWDTISATVYENRKLWPRAEYQIRIAKATGASKSQAPTGGEGGR